LSFVYQNIKKKIKKKEVIMNQQQQQKQQNNMWIQLEEISTFVACKEKDPLALIANSKLMSRQQKLN